eukprot:Tbor_TRINITY_DN4996_c0_g1::TRINITY_DN4996_c0_g1_i2::g.9661::m.9661
MFPRTNYYALQHQPTKSQIFFKSLLILMSTSPISVKVLLFGEIAAIVLEDLIDVEFHQTKDTAKSVWKTIQDTLVSAVNEVSAKAKVRDIMGSAAFAINEEFVQDGATVVDLLTDTLAVIPPVSGG